MRSWLDPKELAVRLLAVRKAVVEGDTQATVAVTVGKSLLDMAVGDKQGAHTEFGESVQP